MAVVNTNLKTTFDVCQSPNCKFITLRDTTGIYNATTNPGGWGDGVINPDADDVTQVTVTVTDPNNVEYIFNAASTIPTTDYLPDINKLKEYPIMGTSIGSTGKIIDGIYKIKITYNGDFGVNTFIEETECSVLLHCQISCCINKLASEVAKANCLDCKKETIEKLENTKRYLQAAKDAIACGLINTAKANLAAAKWYCNEHNCKSCFK